MNNTPLNQVGLQDLIDAVANLTSAIDGLTATVDGLVTSSVAQQQPAASAPTQTPQSAPAPTQAPQTTVAEEAPVEEKPKAKRGRKKKEESDASAASAAAASAATVTPALTTAEVTEANNELIQISTRIGDGGASIFQIMGDLGLRSLADIGTNRHLFNTLMERVRALEA